jgi:hypothetical protein
MVRSHHSQTIAAGHSQILDEPFTTTTTTSARSAPTPIRADLPTRVLLRPIINLAPPDPCRGIRTTLSVNDATTQQPLAFIPQDPIRVLPQDPIRYSFLTTYPSGPIHLHVTNAFAPQEPISPPIQVKMGFQTADGVILQSTVVTLMPGKSATLIQTTSPSDPVRPVVSSVPVPIGNSVPVPISGIVTSAELVDALSARAIFFYPPTPIRGMED